MSLAFIAAKLQRYRWPLLTAVLCIAAALRFYGLGAAPLWLDETSTAWLSSRSWSYLWNDVSQFENHPVLYFAILKVWREIAGSSEFALRFPSAVASLGVVGLTFVSGWIVGGRKRRWMLGLAAAAVAAFWRFEIAHAADARMYAFAAMSVALLTAGVLGLVTRPEALRVSTREFLARERGSLGALVTVALGLAATLWSHTVGVIPAAVAGLFLVGWWLLVLEANRRAFEKLAVAGLAAAALYAPSVPMLIAQLSRDYDFWIDAPTIKDLGWMTALAFGQPTLDLGPGNAVVVAVLMLLGAVGLWRVARAASPQGHIVFAFILVMIAGHWVLTVAITYLYQPILLPRTLIFIHGPLFVLLGALPWAFSRWRGPATVAFGVFLVVGAFQPSHLLSDPRPYKEVTRLIAESDRPNAPIVIVPNFIEVGLLHHAAERGITLDHRAYPGPFPAAFGQIPDIDMATAEAMVRELGDAETVWVFVRRLSRYDPDKLLYRALERSGRERTIVLDGEDHHETLSRFDARAPRDTLAEEPARTGSETAGLERREGK